MVFDLVRALALSHYLRQNMTPTAVMDLFSRVTICKQKGVLNELMAVCMYILVTKSSPMVYLPDSILMHTCSRKVHPSYS